MNLRRTLLLVPAATALMGVAQVAGPITIGPSWGRADPNGNAASLYTTVINHGVLPDRIRSVSCPGYGQVAETGLDPATQGNGDDDHGVLVPRGGRAVLTPDGAHITLSDSQLPLHDGTLVPCSLHFVRSGQRVVVFTIGAPDPAVDEP